MKKTDKMIRYWNTMLSEALGDKADVADFGRFQAEMGLDPSRPNVLTDAILDKLCAAAGCDDGEFTDPDELYVTVDVKGHSENDGIGPYEYWGSRGVDRGVDYGVVDDFDFDQKKADGWLESVGLNVDWADLEDDDVRWDGGFGRGRADYRGKVTVADRARCEEFFRSLEGSLSECDAASPGTGVADVLGGCDHASGEGYLGPDCFHVPSKVMPTLRRIAAAAPKGRKRENAYAAGARLLDMMSERRLVEELCRSSLNESRDEIRSGDAYKALNDIRRRMKDPSALDRFVKEHWSEIQGMDDGDGLQGDSKKVFHTAWELLKRAVGGGGDFVRKHWKKILFLLLIVAAMLWFGKTQAGTSLGLKLFGMGKGLADKAAAYGAAVADDIRKMLPAAFDGGEKIAGWVEVSPDEVERNIGVGAEALGDLTWYRMKDGQSCYAHPDMPGRFFKPVN